VSVFIYFNSKTYSVSFSRQNENYFNPSCEANISDGWDRPVVRIGDCGSLDPGAIPGPDLSSSLNSVEEF
jgi:hypothetical protein